MLPTELENGVTNLLRVMNNVLYQMKTDGVGDGRVAKLSVSGKFHPTTGVFTNVQVTESKPLADTVSKITEAKSTETNEANDTSDRLLQNSGERISGSETQITNL